MSRTPTRDEALRALRDIFATADETHRDPLTRLDEIYERVGDVLATERPAAPLPPLRRHLTIDQQVCFDDTCDAIMLRGGAKLLWEHTARCQAARAAEPPGACKQCGGIGSVEAAPGYVVQCDECGGHPSSGGLA